MYTLSLSNGCWGRWRNIVFVAASSLCLSLSRPPPFQIPQSLLSLLSSCTFAIRNNKQTAIFFNSHSHKPLTWFQIPRAVEKRKCNTHTHRACDEYRGIQQDGRRRRRRPRRWYSSFGVLHDPSGCALVDIAPCGVRVLCICRSSSSVCIPCFCRLLRNSSSATTPQNFLFAVCLSPESSQKIIITIIIIIIIIISSSISQSPQFFLSLNLSRISLCRRLSLQSLCRVSLSVVEISRVSPSVVSLPISYPFLNFQLRSLLSQWTSLHWWSLFDPDVGSRLGVLVRHEILKMMVLWCCCS